MPCFLSAFGRRTLLYRLCVSTPKVVSHSPFELLFPGRLNSAFQISAPGFARCSFHFHRHFTAYRRGSPQTNVRAKLTPVKLKPPRGTPTTTRTRTRFLSSNPPSTSQAHSHTRASLHFHFHFTSPLITSLRKEGRKVVRQPSLSPKLGHNSFFDCNPC